MRFIFEQFDIRLKKLRGKYLNTLQKLIIHMYYITEYGPQSFSYTVRYN